LLLAVLLYVVVDLSCAEMPGAFVFDAADSVESIDASRTRVTARVVILPPPPIDAVPVSPSRRDPSHGAVARSHVTPRRHSVVCRLPRALCDPAPSSEDPH